MSAEMLREAAQVLRERAEAATPGPWRAEPGSTGPAPQGKTAWPSHYVANGATPYRFKTHSEEDAAYIATVHPAVGLALAKWLDDLAAGWPWDSEVMDHDDNPLSLDESMDSHAVRVAVAILGRSA